MLGIYQVKSRCSGEAEHTLVEFKAQAGCDNFRCRSLHLLFESLIQRHYICNVRSHAECLSMRSVSAVIRSVSSPPVLRIDVVGPDPTPVLLLLSTAGLAQFSAGPVRLRTTCHDIPGRRYAESSATSRCSQMQRWVQSYVLDPIQSWLQAQCSHGQYQKS